MARHARPLKNITRTKSRRSSAGRSVGITFAETVHAYIASGGEGRYLVGSLLVVELGEFDVSEIDQQMVDSVAEKHWRGRSPSTCSRQCYGPISAVLKFAARQGWCKPFRLARPRSVKHAPSLPTDAQLYTFLHACRRAKRILIFLLRTDATLAEALGLDWSDVDFDNQTARCVRPDGRERTIEFGGKVLATLTVAFFAASASASPPVGRVFLTHQGKPYRQKKTGGGQLKTALANAAIETGIKINVRVLKQIRKARLLGARPDIDESDDAARYEAAARILNSSLTRCRELESNAPAN